MFAILLHSWTISHHDYDIAKYGICYVKITCEENISRTKQKKRLNTIKRNNPIQTDINETISSGFLSEVLIK